MHLASAGAANLSRKDAIELVDKAIEEALPDISRYPELSSYLVEWSLESPTRYAGRMPKLSLRYHNLAMFILDNGIGRTDTTGFRMRYNFRKVIEAIGVAAVSFKAESGPAEATRGERNFFATDWKSLGRRLTDEHDLRNTERGDEMS